MTEKATKGKKATKEIRLRSEFKNTTPIGEKKDLSGEMPAAYEPPRVEAAWYDWWVKKNFFAPEYNSQAKEKFVIVIPPPNVTGSLHLGHALTNSIEDALVRWHRMCGKATLWVPGTDHAGIATQAVVEKKLMKQKISKYDLGRENFVKEVWSWKNEYGNKIVNQLKRLGGSYDWSRETFTMDPKLSNAVNEAFVKLHSKGLIYRANRLVNWSTALRTAISDIEVDTIEIPKKTKLRLPGYERMIEFGTITKFAYPIDGADGHQYFSWSYGGRNVVVKGSWDQWTTPVQLEKNPNSDIFEARVKITLPPEDNFFQYKFIVDGTWVHDVEKPTITDSNGNINNIAAPDFEIIVATTRPETMLGDTAVAIHPDDPRYKKFHGKQLQHPFLDRKIPIICDPILVDMNFGTGAVKVTPAHDHNDFECGKRNKLPMINILNTDGTINEHGGKYSGQKRFDARYQVLEDLQQKKLFRGVSDNPMTLSQCSRSGDIIEPLLIPQWWMNCDDMAAKAIKAVETGELQIIPEQHKSTWYNWLKNIQQWCISRQLWWGHRIPAYLVHLKGQPKPDLADDKFWVSATTEKAARLIAKQKFGTDDFTLEQDPDVLDTWFSSGLFPFSVFGWPENTSDLQKYYPTEVLETGYDILFFWVARMVMLGLELTEKLPFKSIYLHAMIRDAHGRKMSKSLGNVIDPIHLIEGITLDGLHESLRNGNLDPKELDVAIKGQKKDYPNGISECGSDALRFALCNYTSQGLKINLDIQRVVSYRNFCNKVWNACKLSLTILGNSFSPEPSPDLSGNESPIDLWILSRLNAAIIDTNKAFFAYDFFAATTSIYNFWLYEFCDYYLEAVKPTIYSITPNPDKIKAVQDTVYTCLDEALKLLHPFMPFLTEDLWQRLPRRPNDTTESICVSRYPTEIPRRANHKIEQDIDLMKKTIHSIRSLRATYGFNTQKQKTKLIINVHSSESKSLYLKYLSFVEVLSYCEDSLIKENESPPPGSAVTIPNDLCEIYLPLKGLVDVATEIKKLQSRKSEIQRLIEGIHKKLNNPKVPDNVKEQDRVQLQSYSAELSNIDTTVQTFQSL